MGTKHRELGLTDYEYGLIVEKLGRTPGDVELAMFSLLWSEHCAYKHSRKLLRRLPTEGERVVMGPGENAGAVDVGNGFAVAFKVESHNHPSAVEPFQGAATGVGGILRDVFAIGARPIAILDSLRFGELDSVRSRRLLDGAVQGIGHYGNSIGVATVGGEVYFEEPYEHNCLVNAMCVGLAKTDDMIRAAAAGVGNSVVLMGATTGRDGIGGASVLASAELGEGDEAKRPTVQVGDPFSEKLLLEACLEIMAKGCVIAIQDMGAAGLTCSAVEMGAKGDLGVELDLDAVPCRETGMTAYEMMLSESQERMLMVLRPGKEEEAKAIFRKWGLDFAVIGRTTDTRRFVVKHQGEVMADMPIKELGDEAPVYDRPFVKPHAPAAIEASAVVPPSSNMEALRRLLGSADLCSKRWVWEQYDHLIQGNTVMPPGGDAAIVRVEDGPKALALTCDVTPRYVAADPFEGGKQAVAEAWRNLTAVGAKPLALTDNLNFGNPERPEVMGQLVEAIRGIGEACRALDFPVVSGNVSLYNETHGRSIQPTPTIGGVGLLEDVTRHATIALKRQGDVILVIGETLGWIGQSAYLRDVCGRAEGAPPPVDLAVERRNGDFLRSLIAERQVSAVHDLSDGGFLVGLAEMALAGGLGAAVTRLPSEIEPPHGALFGEDQARYIVTVDPARLDQVANRALAEGVVLTIAGKVGGEAISIPEEPEMPLRLLREAHEGWLPRFMAGPAAA